MPTETVFSNIEFGICVENNNENLLSLIPIDQSVKTVLSNMHEAFYNTYNSISGDVKTFEASEKYADKEKLVISLDCAYLVRFRQLFTSALSPTTISPSEQVKFIVYYFAIFHFNNGNKCIGVKRPAQFKSLLKKRNALMRWVDDTLIAIPDDVFKLDNDFDFIIHSNQIEILRPTSFALLAEMDDQLLSAAVTNTIKLQEQMTFIKFDDVISNFVNNYKSKTAAKLIASICCRDDLNRTIKDKLVEHCRSLGVILTHQDNAIQPVENHVIDFLRILDRREYNIDLTDSAAEIYVAPSRHIKT